MNLLGISTLLRIDGVAMPFSCVTVLAQSDPHPGGHKFFLSYRGPDAARLFDGLHTQMGAPSADRSREILGCVERQLPGSVGRPGFLLNRVELFVIEPANVQIAGVCSPIVPAAGSGE
jgi:hypothetical protein